MGLLKALLGPKSRIATSVTPFHNGYVYLTVDDGGLYADVKLEDGTEKRIRVEGSADMQASVYDTTGQRRDVFSYVDAQKPVPTGITLTASGWDSTAKTQAVTVNGVLADESKQLIQPVPYSASRTAYHDAGVQCVSQAANKLTFSCSQVPTANLSVYVVVTPLG